MISSEPMETKLLIGYVQSGFPSTSHPLADVPVIVYEATAQDPSVVGSATTNNEGRFELLMGRDTSERIFYAVATVNEDVELVTIIGSALQYDRPAWITASPPDVASDRAGDVDEHGPNDTAYIIINELTTVAAAFSMAQFIENGMIGGDAFGLQIASLMNDNLVDKTHGVPSEVLLSPPNADQTNSLRSTRSLANLIAACVNRVPDALEKLFEYTTPPYGGGAPTNTFEAMFNIARYPANNVTEIYDLSKAAEIYSPTLEAAPDAWTLAVKVNDTGSDDFLFGGPTNIAFDKRGYAWIPNNVRQGTPYSGQFAVVLKPNGKPADGKATTSSEGEEGLPSSPLFGGGLWGGGFGVATDRDENVWLSNFGWGGDPPPSEGSVSVFNSEGNFVSPKNGFIGGTKYVQDIAVDQDNNVWLASNGNASVVVYPNPPLESAMNNSTLGPATIDDGYGPFGIAIAKDGSAWVTSAAGLWAYTPSNLSRFRIENGQLTCVYCRKFGLALKGLAIDSMGNIWVPSGGEDRVYMLDSEGANLVYYSGGGICGPWTVAVDGNDNVWVANFGKMVPGNVYTTAAISVLAGANEDTRPPGFETGQAISPTSGYTLPTAGAPVTLNNGKLLYSEAPLECRHPGPSCTPMMRLTSVVIDQAGNVWAVNNWKPDFDVDTSPKAPQCGNPGGDGIVIFVGLAKPPKR